MQENAQVAMLELLQVTIWCDFMTQRRKSSVYLDQQIIVNRVFYCYKVSRRHRESVEPHDHPSSSIHILSLSEATCMPAQSHTYASLVATHLKPNELYILLLES